MMEKWEAGFEVVHGKYIRKGGGIFKKLSAALYYKLLRLLADSRSAPPANVTNFHLISRRVADIFISMPEQDRFSRGMFAWIGFRSTEIEFRRSPRARGKTKYGLWKLLRIASSGITSFSTVPLRWALYLSFVFLIFALGCFGYIVWSIVVGATVPGWASILSTILIFGSIQLVVLGIIGEYLGKVLTEVKRRPPYVVREFFGTKPQQRPNDRS